MRLTGTLEVPLIDAEGYRLNVGIVLVNPAGQVFWARRLGQDAWQFPQGGIKRHETTRDALFRELAEETGLAGTSVEVLAESRCWLRYRLPRKMIRQDTHPVCVGQKQKWFLLKLVSGDQAICMDTAASPEFDDWQWVTYWYPLGQVVAFKREVYRRALREFAPIVHDLELSV